MARCSLKLDLHDIASAIRRAKLSDGADTVVDRLYELFPNLPGELEQFDLEREWPIYLKLKYAVRSAEWAKMPSGFADLMQDLKTAFEPRQGRPHTGDDCLSWGNFIQRRRIPGVPDRIGPDLVALSDVLAGGDERFVERHREHYDFIEHWVSETDLEKMPREFQGLLTDLAAIFGRAKLSPAADAEHGALAVPQDAGFITEASGTGHPEQNETEHVTPGAPLVAAAIDGTANDDTGSSKKERQLRWLAEAMLLVRDHPDWSDAEIARKVKKAGSTLSRSEEYQAAAAMARGDKANRPPGHVTVDPDSGLRDVEAVSPNPTQLDSQADRGQAIPDSKYFREYCADCGEPIGVPQKLVGTSPRCEHCQQ